MPYQFIHPAHTQLCHIFPQFLRDKFHKVFHVLRFAPETLPQFRILGCNAHRTGVQIADTHHDAPHGHKRRRSKTELLRPEDRRDGHIPAAHQLPVGLDPHLAPQPVLDQCLVRLRKPQLPGQPRIVDRRPGCRPGAAVVAGHKDHLGPGLRHARCHRAHTGLRHQFYRDPRLPARIFQIVDQLRQILDGIDIMVGRRRDQAHAGGGMSGLRDPGIDFAARQMPTLSGFCSLGHLDLDLLCAVQVATRHTETSGSHLLDGGAFILVAAACGNALLLLAALACVGFPMEMIHGNGKCLMGLL